jgi:transposase
LSQSTTVLFGLPGVRVQRVELDEDGVRVVHVETAPDTSGPDTSGPGCPTCGVVSTSVKGLVTTAPRDIPYGVGDISVVWHKRRWRCRWRCRELACARLSFTESIEQVPAGRRTTGRLRTAMGAAIGDAARSVAEVAASFSSSWPTAHAAFIEHADALLVAAEPTTVLGIDETRRGKPRWVRDEQDKGAQGTPARWPPVDPYDTGFGDLAGVWGLWGQREGRTSACVLTWLQAQTPEFREAIGFVAIDPAAV